MMVTQVQKKEVFKGSQGFRDIIKRLQREQGSRVVIREWFQEVRSLQVRRIDR